MIGNLGIGFATAFSVANMLYCLTGCVLGTLVGVLPGLGPVATIAMLLPLTFVLPPASSLIMLAGIYYGAQYGGSTTAILVNLPGESSSVVTAIDGYRMARAGRAGPALAAAALASFAAGTIATLVLAVAAPPLAALALRFGPADHFSLVALGLVTSLTLTAGPLPKAAAVLVLGLALGTVGTDVETGLPRYTFGLPGLADGLDFVALATGLFGLGEILRNLAGDARPSATPARAPGLLLSRDELRRIVKPTLRGTALGSILGLLPGGGAMLASFAAYALEKRVSKAEPPLGSGAIEGVAAPEAANNAGAQTSFIPMLTLGLPPNPVMALMVGALTIHGISPGPEVITAQPALFWGTIVSMWLGNLFLLVLNLPLVGLWARLAAVPYHLLFPCVVAVCCVGVYSLNNSALDVLVMALAGLLGCLLPALGFDPVLLLLGFVLAPPLEQSLRQALIIAHGDPGTFLRQPLSALLLALAAAILTLTMRSRHRRS